jgi:hypothetical protein
MILFNTLTSIYAVFEIYIPPSAIDKKKIKYKRIIDKLLVKEGE